MPEMPSPTNMNEYLEIMRRSRESLEKVIVGRSLDELTGLRDAGGWAVKDHLFHLAAWERGMTYLLQKRPRYEGMGLDERSYVELDTDAINDIIFTHSRDRPLAQVMDEFRSSHREFLDVLGSMTFEDLQRPYSWYNPDDTVPGRDQPVFNWVFGNTAHHFAEHREWIEQILAQPRG
jgi:hypothetical protein